jgi:hypothetical protein
VSSLLGPRLGTSAAHTFCSRSADASKPCARLGVLRRRTGQDSAREIREYCTPGFSNWKNHNAFHRLIADPKSSSSKIE